MAETIFFDEERMRVEKKKLLNISSEIKTESNKIYSLISELANDSDCINVYNEFINIRNGLNSTVTKLEDLCDDMELSAEIYKDADKASASIISSEMTWDFGQAKAVSLSASVVNNDDESWWEELWNDGKEALDNTIEWIGEKVQYVCQWFNEIDWHELRINIGKGILGLKTIAFDIIGGGLLLAEGIGLCFTGGGLLVGIPMIIMGATSVINGCFDLFYEVKGQWDKVGETNVLDTAIKSMFDEDSTLAQPVSNVVQLGLSILSVYGMKKLIFSGFESAKGVMSNLFPQTKTTSELIMIGKEMHLITRSSERVIKWGAGINSTYNFVGSLLDIDSIVELGKDFVKDGIDFIDDKISEESELVGGLNKASLKYESIFSIE